MSLLTSIKSQCVELEHFQHCQPYIIKKDTVADSSDLLSDGFSLQALALSS